MKVTGHFHILFFFFNNPATTEIYPLPPHDALPTSDAASAHRRCRPHGIGRGHHLRRHRASRRNSLPIPDPNPPRSEEHTSELQSQSNIVCRLLLEKKTSHNWFRG